MSFHSPKKYLSQNFLEDAYFQKRIVEAFVSDESDVVVEIGPGYGALTSTLVRREADRFYLIDVDPEVTKFLQSNFSEIKNLEIVNRDVLEVNFGIFGDNLRIIGNLPYHLSSPILFHINCFKNSIKSAVLMLQKEVIDRLTASPGSKQYGRLSVSLQLNWKVEKVLDVPPEAFRPSPRVWSSVVVMTPHSEFSNVRVQYFEKILKAAFSKRRKTLKNALKGFVTEQELIDCSIDPTARPESLSVEQYVLLARVSFDSHLP